MSLPRYYAQRLTRSFVLNGQGPEGSNYVATFAQSDFDAWYAANSAVVKKTGSVYTISGNSAGTSFIDVLLGNNGATQLNHDSGYNNPSKKTIKDFGKEIHIGNGAESDLLVFRQVQFAGPAELNGVPTDSELTAYVVIENNASNLGNNNARFRVAVARV